MWKFERFHGNSIDANSVDADVRDEVYICATRGAAEIIEAFNSIGVDVSNIQFIDLVSSGILGGTDVPYDNITFVDSPIMLESVLLRTLYTLRIISSE